MKISQDPESHFRIPLSWHKANGKWRAELKVGGKAYYLGEYKQESSATAAVAAAREALARGESLSAHAANAKRERRPERRVEARRVDSEGPWVRHDQYNYTSN